ncbi:MAG: CUAEP/CCAEP-tail radical SAM protein [Nitrospirota bacterium]|nr:CUAEP/CCAEP-tail radical SAM protein [Nitrospirota bacterium]MDP2383576.1 CUAEP/CCAEP-tail radical SAM protein [Nitrospirota bacterium]
MEQLTESTDRRSALRQPGAILLISCYELGHQPIGIAQPMGFLEQAGFAPTGLDIAIDDLDEAALRLAHFVGISVPMHTALRLGVRVAELIRTMNPACHICFYGLYASINTDYLLQTLADSVVGGEYEVPLRSLLETLDRNQAINLLEGVSSRHRMVSPSLQRGYASTASAVPHPIPSRRGLPMLDRYARLEEQGAERLVGYVEASRGCLHHCLHCPIVPVYDGRFVLVPESVVLEDIRRQVQAGATHITFGDPDFLNGPGHSLNIVRAMHEEFPRLTFDFTAKIEHLLKRRALMPDLRAQGCLFVISAVESFSDPVLEVLQKGHTGADIISALNILREAGIALRPSLVAFTPWTSLDDYLYMLDMVDMHDLIDATDPVQLSIRLLVPPGSALLDQSDIRQFLGALDQAGFQYPWTHPDERMDRLHQAVSGIVEASAKDETDAMLTFDRIRTVAHEMAGRLTSPSTRPTPARLNRQKPPRLTESWFCCAEPTTRQFKPLLTKGHGEI